MLFDRSFKYCSAISISIKHQICEWSKNNKNKKHEEIVSYFNKKYLTLNIYYNTVIKILAQSERWNFALEIEDSKEIYKHKGVKFSELDKAMSLWIESIIAGGVILIDSLIKEKVRVFTNAFNIQEDELVFSND